MRFAGEFTSGVSAGCVSLQLFSPAFDSFFTCGSSVFASKLHVILLLVAGKFALVPHRKLPLEYPLYSSKLKCGYKHFACALCETPAA